MNLIIYCAKEDKVTTLDISCFNVDHLVVAGAFEEFQETETLVNKEF